MMKERGCKEDVAIARYDWDLTFMRCPQTLFTARIRAAHDWWHVWRMTGEGPTAATLAESPAYVKQAICIFEHERNLAIARDEEKARKAYEVAANG